MVLKKSLSLRYIIMLQAAVILYTCTDIAAKLASGYPFLSMGFVLCYSAEILILGIYALCWQQIIKKVDISVAYSNRASAIFWATLWAAVIFQEHISLKNIIGIVIIFAGIWMVNRDA